MSKTKEMDMSAFCMKCGKSVANGLRARGHDGVVSWCINCPPSEEYLWDRCTIQSKTGWMGGRVGMDSEDETVDIDPRDFGAREEFNPRDAEAPGDYDAATQNAMLLRLRRDRVTGGPLAGIDLVRYMRTGVVAKLGAP